MLYWAIFTLGFMAGAILSFSLFAAKDSDEETNILPEKAEHKTGNGTLFGPPRTLWRYFRSAFDTRDRM